MMGKSKVLKGEKREKKIIHIHNMLSNTGGYKDNLIKHEKLLWQLSVVLSSLNIRNTTVKLILLD